MMIHDQILSTQILRDVKSEHSALLHAHNLPGLNMDLYSAYAFQAHLQQQHQQQQQNLLNQLPEVLDLSRRCDSVETSRKTPSPYQTNSSAADTPPSLSPNSIKPHFTTNESNQTSLYAPALYPMLYFPHKVPTPELMVTTTTKTSVASVPNSNLLQTFVSAAASTVGNIKIDTPTTLDSSKSINLLTTTKSNNNHNNNNNNNSNQDIKSTRPFKAFPRDPLVIAANFAANDVLLDNPRVERYTEYRKRVLEQIRNSNGGSRTVTNPKMRRTSQRSNCISDAMATSSYNINQHSENEGTVEESSDCESNAGNFERMSSSMTSSASSTDLNDANNNIHGGTISTSNNNISHHDSNNNNNNNGQLKDAAYYERRRKNNAAAKKSRDRRRIKEDEIAIRAAYLERQNIELLCQIDSLKAQLALHQK